MKDLLGLNPQEITEIVTSLGDKPFRARQLLNWIYSKGVSDFDEMTDLSIDFRQRLSSLAKISKLVCEKITTSENEDNRHTEDKESDKTAKLLFRLDDGKRIESVIIPDGKKRTLCVSSQVGCALGCTFCMTGKMGFIRNLTAKEIVGQVIAAEKYLSEIESTGGKDEESVRISNIVFMGMGEPLLNYDEVVRAFDIISSGWGLEISWRKITLSTAGIPDAILRLGRERNINLAVSLNAPDDKTRSSIMPINRKYPLKDIIKTLRDYPLKKRSRITIEYVLIKGINDTKNHARKLSEIVSGLKSKINLIPFNPYPGSEFERPNQDVISRFQETLIESNINTIVRKSKGSDISAACGQLATGKNVA